MVARARVAFVCVKRELFFCFCFFCLHASFLDTLSQARARKLRGMMRRQGAEENKRAGQKARRASLPLLQAGQGWQGFLPSPTSLSHARGALSHMHAQAAQLSLALSLPKAEEMDW